MLWDRILDKCSIKADSVTVSESESAARGNDVFHSECFFLSCVAILMSWTLNLCIDMEFAQKRRTFILRGGGGL